jgi:hypothetical protein
MQAVTSADRSDGPIVRAGTFQESRAALVPVKTRRSREAQERQGSSEWGRGATGGDLLPHFTAAMS